MKAPTYHDFHLINKFLCSLFVQYCVHSLGHFAFKATSAAFIELFHVFKVCQHEGGMTNAVISGPRGIKPLTFSHLGRAQFVKHLVSKVNCPTLLARPSSKKFLVPIE